MTELVQSQEVSLSAADHLGRCGVENLEREMATFLPFFDRVQSLASVEPFTRIEAEGQGSVAFVLPGTFNFSFDIQGLLRQLKTRVKRSDRIVVILHNPYFRGLQSIAAFLGWMPKHEKVLTHITMTDLLNICTISGFQLVRYRPVSCWIANIPGLGKLLSAILLQIPLLRSLSLKSIAVLRPIIPEKTHLKMSVIVPARNERGNISAAISRLEPKADLIEEVIFVEGHSQDGTWEEIQARIQNYAGPLKLSAYRQTGIGKVDAVRLGFAKAQGDLLTILDADLTMPPELLDRFYDAYVAGYGDFINGSRLVYPMEDQAMRVLNHLGNTFFAKLLSHILETRVGDTLCGTKLLSKRDYERFAQWRAAFGDFDPFGDFELLFPAAILGLGIIDIPVRYRDRTYGSTNISRFRHGFMLLKMSIIGFTRIKLGLHRPTPGTMP